MTIPRRLLALVTTAALIGTTAACGGEDTKDGSGEYAIGYIGDLSGPYAALGTPLRDGMAAFYKELNASGGIDGHKVKFSPFDDGQDPTKAIAAAKQLTQSKVSGIHTFTSNIVTALLPILKQTKTATIAQAPTAALVLPPQPEVFGGDVLIPSLSRPMVDFVIEKAPAGGKRLAILALESAAIAELVAGVKSKAEERGWTVVREEIIAASTVTARPQASAIASEKPDAVLMAVTDTLAISAVPELRARNFDGPVVNYQGGNAYSTFERLADPGYYAVRPWTFPADQESNDNVKTYLKAMKAAKLDPNLPYHINGYVQALAMAEGLRKCGYPCAPSDLQKALADLGEVDTSGLTTGKFEFSSDNHLGPQSTAFYHWDIDSKKPVAAGEPAALEVN